MSCSCSNIQNFGASPINLNWCIVRGDTGTLRVKFFETDEETSFDTDSWTYAASAYDNKSGVTYNLTAHGSAGYVDVIAPASVTELWGSGYGSVVAELTFDIQVTMPADGEDTIWTPVIGTISVLGDITGSL